MITNPELFERLVDEAWQHDFSGWDFHFIKDRWIEQLPAWDYRQIVLEQMKDCTSMLDIGTGGGEFLSTLHPFPVETYATECYPPSTQIAQKRLEPLGVKVLSVPDVYELPFPENSLDLVINRHADIMASEVFRVLKPGRSFITQQVGGENMIALNRRLQDEANFIYSYWTLAYVRREIEAAGFRIIDQREDFPLTTFKDIGAVVFFLKVIDFQVEGFTPEKYMDRLAAIHNTIQETGGFNVHAHRFLFEARK
jgi:SAM-dependent methyltransferase